MADNYPLVSIVIPCLNEERVIASVIQDCKDGLQAAGVSGQILIVDSSTDSSPEIAEKLGAEVLRVPRRGLGRAYLDAIPFIHGKYVIMGDADGTYDFKVISPFIAQMEQGADFVMGTRLKGVIEDGAIPKLHRYFGTPLTTWILNRLFKLNFSDIHCGLRALTTDSLRKIDLKSQSWEYASEMVIKAGLLNLHTEEVPIHFYKDREGRLSHHRRSGWFSPWYAGWINLKIMLLYAPNFIFYIPGALLLILGSIMLCLTSTGLVPHLQWHAAITGLVLMILGYFLIQMGILSKVFSDLNKYYEDRLTRFLKERFTYSKGMVAGVAIIGVGMILSCVLLVQWILNGFVFENEPFQKIPIFGLAGLALITLGFQTVWFTFIYEVFKISTAKMEDVSLVLRE